MPPISSLVEKMLLKQLTLASKKIPFNNMLGLQLQSISQDHATMRFLMKKELVGNYIHGILHGGVIASVLDMAGGLVVMASAIQKHRQLPSTKLLALIGKTSTVDLQVSFLRPGRGEFFTAYAWLIKSGAKIAFSRMELHNQKDSLIATGSGTYTYQV